jgi:bifunctional DNA-binding transcriptional regulator/antitoxin component of YhaV-PrlF toxin-antitoxin module
VNTYRGRLVSKNQMTIPVPMQRELGLNQGDELEFVIHNGKVGEVSVLKAVPVDLLPRDVLESLKKRKASQPPEQKLSSAEVKRRAEEKREAVRTPAGASAGD